MCFIVSKMFHRNPALTLLLSSSPEIQLKRNANLPVQKDLETGSFIYLFNFNLHLTGLQNISKAKARGLNGLGSAEESKNTIRIFSSVRAM